MTADGTEAGPPLGEEVRVLHLLQVPVIVADARGIITSWNDQAQALYGWTREEALGRPLGDFLIHSHVPPQEEGPLQTLTTGTPWQGDVQTCHRDGALLVCHTSASPLRDGDGRIVGMIAVSTDVTARKRGERRLAARTAVTNALANAESLPEVAPELLRSTCQTLGWALGALWRVDRGRGVLWCVDVWHGPGDGIEEFAEATRRTRFEPGAGLPGRVWAAAAPLWLPDVPQEQNFTRADLAARAGLHAGFGFPIMLGGDVHGVIEFFSPRLEPPDEDLLQTISVIGSQIGQFMERKQAEAELRQSRDQLGAILQGVADGISVQDAEGRVIYANEALAQLCGYATVDELLQASAEEILGLFEVADEQGRPVPPERLPGRRSLRTARVTESTVSLRNRRTGELGWSQIRSTPVLDEVGKLRYVVNIVHDFTRDRRSADTQRFLAEASELLSGSLDHRETLRRLASLVVPRLADWCSIEMLEEDGTANQLAVAHVDPKKVGWARELRRRFPTSSGQQGSLPDALRTGRSTLYPEVTDGMIEESVPDPEYRRIVQDLGMRSVMVVPLVARGTTLGAITLVSAESGRRFNQDDLSFAEQLAQRAALAVDNARLFQEQSEIAQALQQSLLPPQLPKIPGVELARAYLPAGRGNQVGGDFYDAFALGGEAWALVIGDVCGKGPQAAGVTGLARHTMRAVAMQERKPSAILHSLNEAVRLQREDAMFCTVAMARLRPDDHGVRLTISCAGHPLPLVVRADGTVETAGRPGTLLGVFPDPDLTDTTVDLRPGDAIVMYTDGVVEEQTTGGEFFGRDRLERILRESRRLPAAGIAGAVERAVTAFRPERARDDMAVLVAKIPENPGNPKGRS